MIKLDAMLIKISQFGVFHLQSKKTDVLIVAVSSSVSSITTNSAGPFFFRLLALLNMPRLPFFLIIILRFTEVIKQEGVVELRVHVGGTHTPCFIR